MYLVLLKIYIKGYIQIQVECVEDTCAAQTFMVNPFTRYIKNMVHGNLLKQNSPFPTSVILKNGPNLASLKII